MKTDVRIIPLFDLLHTKIKLYERTCGKQDDEDPVNIARQMCLGGADEIAFIDVDTVRLGFKIWEDIIHQLKEAVDIPILFGYSMNTYENFEVILEAGVDRVIIDVIADTDPSMIDRLARNYGKDRVVVEVGGKKNPPGSNKPEIELVDHISGEATGVDLTEWLKAAEYFGAGMVMLSSHDTAGLGKGYDLTMTKTVTDAISLPVIAAGGAGELEDFYKIVADGGVSGVAASTVFASNKFRPSEIKEYLEARQIKVAE